MKPFRKHVAIAIDGGGIRGIVATRALMMLEEALGESLHDVFRLAAGTSTGSIIAAGLGAGLTAKTMNELYLRLGKTVFKKSWRTFFFPFTRYQYSSEPLQKALHDQFDNMKMGDFWNAKPRTDVVTITMDLFTNKSRFIKPWKPEYKDWPIVTAVLASSSIPAYFPVVEGRYVDGGIGSYANPCYIAAYEALFCLKWKLEETTLISLGTGRDPQTVKPGQAEKMAVWDWLVPLEDAFLSSTSDQQVHLVETFFKGLDFRRFQVDFKEYIALDDPNQMDKLLAYGEQMGAMILNDKVDSAMNVKTALPKKTDSI